MKSKMPKPPFVDTGYIIALINPNDTHHQEARHWSNKYDRHPIITTDAVLLEIGNALSRIARPEAVKIIEYFRTAPETTIIPLTPQLFTSAIDLYTSYQDKTWGLVDCISFIVMADQQLSVALSFDRHFIQAGFTLAPLEL
jgi:uncharacterized protein